MSTPYAENFDKAYDNASMLLETSLLGWTDRKIRLFGACKVDFMTIARQTVDFAVSNRVDFQCKKPVRLAPGDDPTKSTPEMLIAKRPLSPYYGWLYGKLKTAWHQAYDGPQSYGKGRAT